MSAHIPLHQLPLRVLQIGLLAIFASLFIIDPVHAEILATDDFETLESGEGWAEAWTVKSGVSIVDDEPITYLHDNGSTIGGGKTLKVAAANDNNALVRQLAHPVTDGRDVFASFIFQIKSKTSSDGTTADSRFCGWLADAEGYNINTSAIAVVGLEGKVAARVNNNTTNVNTVLKFGQTYFLVIKYTGWNGTAYRTCQVWLNPTTSQENATSDTITATRAVSAGGSAGFRGFRIRSYNLSENIYHLVSSLRVGTTWADVMPEVEDGAFTVATENEDWFRLNHSLEIAPGGVFDFSEQGILDAPAGKHGAIKATADGHFEFENRPGVRARFWGINLVQNANFLTNAQADILAERLARSGYNAVRIHHYDEYLVGSSLAAGKNSWELDTARLDKLDYLFAALKNKGIYINIDLYSSRGFSTAEAESFGVSSTSIAKNYFKGLIPVSPAALDSWKKFATALLTHSNPYTGMTWGDDPALIGICPVNENQPHHNMSHGEILPRYEARFAELETPLGETVAERKIRWNRFLFENSFASNDEMAAHIRSLGVKAPLTTANTTKASAMTILRSRYDYVDDHLYWDHPSFPETDWALPINFTQSSATKNRAYLPARMMPSRVFGKPFTSTEFHYSRPNRFRAEGALLMPAYASLQDWDALYNFDYAKDVDSAMQGTADNYFAIANDPVGLIGDRLGALLFQRRDIAPATTTIAYAVREDEAYASDAKGNPGREYDESFQRIGLIARVGSLPGEPAAILTANPGLAAAIVGPTPALSPLPAKTYASVPTINTTLQAAEIIPADSVSADGNVFTSETREIQLNTLKGTLRVVTERGEHFILTPGGQLTGNRVSVTNGDAFGAITVVALKTADDGEMPTLANTRRILVTHLTDSLNTGMSFATPSRKQLTSWGALPHLVRRGEATLDLTLPAGEWTAWSVDMTGARTGQHALTRIGETDTWRMTISTAGTSETGARFAYELARGDFTPVLAPTISSVTPLQVQAGDSITITGANLTGATVAIDGVAATVTAGTDTSLTVTIPAGAGNGIIVVTTAGGATTAAQTLIIGGTLPPGLIATDDFDSYPAGPISTLNGGIGWDSAGWYVKDTITNAMTVVTDAPIIYTLDNGDTRGGGNALKLTGNFDGIALGRKVATHKQIKNGDPVFVSFLFQIKDTAQDDGYKFTSGNIMSSWQAYDNTPSYSNDTLVVIGAAGQVRARVKGGDGASPISGLLNGKTYLLVVKYTGWDGVAYRTSEVWINPKSTDENTTTSSIKTAKTDTAGGSDSFLGIAARTYSLSETKYQLIDDIRIGETWASVVGTPPMTPAISAISPYEVHVGDTITITGTNLAGATVTIGGVTATVVTNTDTTITVIVPEGAADGAVVVTTQHGSGTAQQQLVITLTTNPLAGLIATENFETYTAGDTIAGANGGTGWNAAWEKSTSLVATIIDDEPLTYTLGNATLGGGKALKLTTNDPATTTTSNYYNALRRTVDEKTGEDVFVRFLFKIKDTAVADGTTFTGNIFCFWEADWAATIGASTGGNGTGGAVGATGFLKARVRGADTSTTTPLQLGQTYLAVIKYTGWDGAMYTTAQVWLNPTTEDENSTDAAVTATKVYTPPTDGSNKASTAFWGLRVRTYGLNVNRYHLYDDFRMGSTWDSVMSAAEPPPPPPPDPENFTVATESDDWVRINHSLDITPGGVFDFSQQGCLDAPAGKHGAIKTTPAGHFEFANRPGERVRFWGVNLVYQANYLSREQADALADRIARSGYNTVRFHHFDTYLIESSSYGPTGAQLTLNQSNLDKIDYLFAALKQRGIYISIDLFSDRPFSQSEADAFGVATPAAANSCFKGLIPINTAAFEVWKEFARQLLTHANPHTGGIAWGADPALIGICPVNEDPLWRQYNATDAILALYRAKFETDHPAYVGTDWDQPNTERNKAWNQFIHDTNQATDARLFAFLKNDLNIKTPLTGANYTIALGLTKVRAQYDYVDNHQYADHPSSTGALPITFSQGSELGSRAFVPARTMPSRIFGKPFAITEFHYCMPNRHRYEGALLMPAYASLQDWDSLYNFDYARDVAGATGITANNYFALSADPLSLVGDRLGALLFQRGDIAPATRAIAYAVRDSEAHSGDLGKEFDSGFRTVGLVARIGSLPGEPASVLAANPTLNAVVTGSPASDPLPAKTYVSSATILTTLKNAGVIPATSSNDANNRVTSDTGQIELNSANRTLRVVTPAGEHFLVSGSQSLTGDRVTIANDGIDAAISVVALKSAAEIAAGAPVPALATASRLLVTHLTDALPKGMTFDATDRKTLKSWGTSPHLVRNGSATLALTLPDGNWTAWAVDITGARTHAHPLERIGATDTWTMTVSTGGTPETGAQFAYELVRADITQPAPVITTIAPLAVNPGDSIIITGSNLAGATVTIGGAMATVTASTATSITATIPNGVIGASIAVAVTTAGGTTTATQTLAITLPLPTAPNVTNISATSAHPGNTITLTGTNLAGATVTIGGVPATVTANTATSITFTVPAGTIGGIVSVTTAGGTFNITQPLTITPDTGSATTLSAPSGIVLASGSSQQIYVSDATQHTIQTIASGTIHLLAGSASSFGYTDASGSDARFNKPRHLTITRAGELLVADSGNNRIRSLTADGIVTTTATTGPDTILASPAGLAAYDGASGETYIADTDNHLIKRITATGEVRIVAGSAISGTTNGALLAARFNKPAGVAVDVSGSYLYVADTGNHVIRLINLATGTVSTFAGSMAAPGLVDGDPLAAAQFNEPQALIVDATGDVYVADTGNSLIRMIASGPPRLVATLAGGAPGFLDGTGTLARFQRPAALAMAEDGAIYVADTGNAAIRRIAPDATATVTTLQLRPGAPIEVVPPPPRPPNPNEDWDQRRGSGGGGAPSLWLLAALAALAATRLRRDRNC